ncbi:hypothetical protein C3942_14280 [Solimonas fluminis]|uniref:Carotenoid biosynthesis protein n=1 Tax=Solimonas fluminis TaxID=2086571 RepID=A0A2S5TEM5_9GAMM|nr:hypothetical protein [Solimonas fluminis]PPE73429.1 hypothetical protein C3942_14280 [Solimonas fluminis]
MPHAESAALALGILRDPAQFKWYVIPLLLLTLHVYAQQVHARRWPVVLGGLAFWLMDWINEIWNALVFHFTQFAPVWGAPGDTAFLILIGLNIEISLMFAVFGVTAILLLPADPRLKLFGINNRLLAAALNSVLAVGVECWLNHAGALTWEYRWWNGSAPWLIWLIGYLPFFLVAYWVHDLPDRRRQLRAVGTLGGIVAGSLLLFGALLGWI